VADKWVMAGKWAVADNHSLAAKIHATHASDSPACQPADLLLGHLADSAENVRLNSARYGHAACHCLPSFRYCPLPLIAS